MIISVVLIGTFVKGDVRLVSNAKMGTGYVHCGECRVVSNQGLFSVACKYAVFVLDIS